MFSSILPSIFYIGPSEREREREKLLGWSDLFGCGLSFQEFELRKHARQEGRRYCDPVVLTYQAERMPEQIRLKVGPGVHDPLLLFMLAF